MSFNFTSTMFLVYTLIVLLFPAVIGLNMLIYNVIVKKALRKFIEPKLKEQKLTFIEYKWPGLLSYGDFKSDGITFTFMNKNGKPFNSIFTYIFYRKENETKKVTVRIDTTFLVITKVVYSSEQL
jgi:hypothetical protein